MRSGRLAVVLAFVALSGCEKATPPASSPTGGRTDGGPAILRQRAADLLAWFRDPKAFALQQLFNDQFLQADDEEKIRVPFEEYIRRYGKPSEQRLANVRGPFQADVEFGFAQARLLVALDLDPRPPHKIAGIHFGGAASDADTLDGLLGQIKALPGKKALLLRRLDPNPETLMELNPDEPLAIGSTFKLFLLAALAEEVAAGKRQWTDVVRIKDEWRSLPSGQLQDWPTGAPLTLYSLAAQMVSGSDNTAADHLLFTLGRESVEAALPRLGVQAPNRPLLATSEMFKLKLVLPQETLAAFAKADEAGRRKLLADAVAKAALREPRLLAQPLAIDQAEWFASPADLVRLLDRLRQPAHMEAGAMLRIAYPLFRYDQERWPFFGWKNGAEMGVSCQTLLFHSAAGPWYALAVAWNDPAAAVDDEKLLGILDRIVRTLQRREQAEKK